jgi:hypothetical protein
VQIDKCWKILFLAAIETSILFTCYNWLHPSAYKQIIILESTAISNTRCLKPALKISCCIIMAHSSDSSLFIKIPYVKQKKRKSTGRLLFRIEASNLLNEDYYRMFSSWIQYCNTISGKLPENKYSRKTNYDLPNARWALQKNLCTE